MKKYNQILSKWENDSIEDISSKNHLEYLNEIIVYINKNKSILDSILQNIEISPAGFGKLKLVNNTHFNSELHFFINNNDLKTNIHTHGFDAFSNVLSGEINEEQFSISKIGEDNEFLLLNNDLNINKNIYLFKEYLIKLSNMGVVNMGASEYFIDALDKDPSILPQIIKDLDLILRNKQLESNNFWTIFLANTVLGVSPNKLSKYFIHFQIKNKGNIKNISNNFLEYIGKRSIQKGNSYNLPNNIAHRVSVKENTSTLLIKQTTNKNDFPGGHFKLLPQSFDKFEIKQKNYNKDLLKEDILKEISIILNNS